MFEIHWSTLSKITFSEEIYFILRKWNQTEVDKFSELVYTSLERLAKNPQIGIYKSQYKCYSLVISKQTTLYYKIIEDISQIDLILFWNNKQNPNDLTKLLY